MKLGGAQAEQMLCWETERETSLTGFNIYLVSVEENRRSGKSKFLEITQNFFSYRMRQDNGPNSSLGDSVTTLLFAAGYSEARRAE